MGKTDNKEFIDILKVCKKINVSEYKLDILKKSSIDFKSIYNMINKSIDESNENITSEILEMFYEIYNASYDKIRGIKLNGEEFGEEEFIEEYKNILSFYTKYRYRKIKSGRKLVLFNYLPQYMSLGKGLNILRVMKIDKNEGIELNFGKVNISSIVTSNDVMNLEINGDNSRNIGGIVVKDNRELFYKVVTKRDEAELIYRLLEYDYDLAIVPNLALLTDVIITKEEKARFSNRVYLDYLLLIGDLYVLSIKPEYFKAIYDTKINLNSLIQLLEENVKNSGVWVKFLYILVSRAKTENRSKEETEKIFKQIENKIIEKFQILGITEYDMYLNNLNNTIYASSLDGILKKVSRDL